MVVSNLLQSMKARNNQSIGSDTKPKRNSFERSSISASKKTLISNSNQMKVQTLKAFDLPRLKAVADKFHKQVQSPIELLTSVFVSKTPQRCLQHNNVSTLYCINDKKPLCVTCMYQNNLHKKHKVVSLNKAGKEMTEELANYLRLVNRSLGVAEELFQESHENLERAQKQFPQIIRKVGQFYEGLHELLVEKKNQQIKHIHQTWSKVKYEYSAIAAQINKINIFTIQKLNQIKQQQNEDSLLFNRNMAEHLSKLNQIISDDMCDYHQNKYMQELKKWTEVQNIINQRLVFTNPLVEVVKRSKSKNRIKEKNIATMSSKSRQILQIAKKKNQPVNIIEDFKQKSKSKDQPDMNKDRQQPSKQKNTRSKGKKQKFKPTDDSSSLWNRESSPLKNNQHSISAHKRSTSKVAQKRQ